MSRLLLHVCCGPCAITVIESLLAEGRQVTGYFYNPNIHPAEEYLRRRDGVAAVANRLGFPVVFRDDDYDPAGFFRQVAFREVKRCRICVEMRLGATAAHAREKGFELFSSTLLYSKYQDHQAIRQTGESLSGQGPVAFLYRDFREGWERGVEVSREWGIYRQKYCGCLYSEKERQEKRLAALVRAEKA